jgi:hypothetical protein
MKQKCKSCPYFSQYKTSEELAKIALKLDKIIAFLEIKDYTSVAKEKTSEV